MIDINFHPDKRALRGFARLWFPLFVLSAGGAVRWRLDLPVLATQLWLIGAVLAVGVLASPILARAVFIALTVATYPIAVVTSTVLLALVFFVVVTPLGVILRLKRHDPLRLRARPAPSHWLACPSTVDPRRAVRQF